MLDLGYVLPGTTLNIPFATYDSNDPSASVTTTGLAATDIEIYKDGNLTQRASDAGYAVDIDFDALTGLHTIQVDLSDNTTAGFFAAGSEYLVAVSDITVDAATVSLWAARFTIGIPGMIHGSNIATYTSTDNFTLTAGSANDDAYNGCILIAYDAATQYQVQVGVIEDYTGSTKTVNLKADPGVFTMAANDNIIIMPPALLPTVAGNTLDVTTTGAAGIDWGNVENQTTAVDLSATDIQLCDTTTTVTNDVGVNEWNGVALGTTNPLPNAAAGAAGGLPTDSTGKTSFNDVSAADVNAQCDTALSDIGLDHLISSALPTNWATDVASGSVFDNIADDGTAAFDRTTDSLQAIADSGGGGPTAAQIADAVWDEAQADHVAVGSFGITASEIADILADTNELQTDDVPGLIAALNDPSAATIADAVWDETQTGHIDAGKAGQQLWTDVDAILVDTAEIGAAGAGLTEAGGTGDQFTALPVVSVSADGAGLTEAGGTGDQFTQINVASISSGAINEAALDASAVLAIASAVWEEAQADHTSAGTMGVIASEIADILVDTNELQTDDVPGLIAALNDIATSDVLTQVNAALDTAISELGVGVPTATPSLRTGLMLLYMALRNKRVTIASADVIYNNAGTAITSAAVSDDATTFTKEKYN